MTSRKGKTVPAQCSNRSEEPPPLKPFGPSSVSSLTFREGILLLLISLFLLLLPFGGGGTHPFGEGLLKILLLLAGFVSVIFLEPVKIPRGLYWAFFLLLWASLSLLWTASLHLSLLSLSHWASGLLLAGILYRVRLGDRVYLVMALGLGLLWLGRMSLIDWVRAAQAGDPTWRVFASFTNPNLYADYLILLIPIFLFLFLRAHRLPWVLASGSVCILAFLSLILTGSRGGMLSLGLGLLYCLLWLGYFLLRRDCPLEGMKVIRGGVRLAILGLLLLPFWGYLSRPIAVRIGERRVQQVASSSFRLYTWRATLRMIKERPFTGAGIGSFPVTFPRFAIAGYTRHSHNSYLQMGAELGLPGLFALLGITFWVLAGLVPRLKKEQRGLGLSLLWGLSAGAIHNLVEGAWLFMACQLLWWGLAGCLIREVSEVSADYWEEDSPKPRFSRANRSEVRRGPSLKPFPWVKVLYLGVLVAVAGGLPAHFAEGYLSQVQAPSGFSPPSSLFTALKIEPWNAEAHRKLAEWYSFSGEIPLALREIERAIHYEPTNGVNHYRKGQLLEMAHRRDLAEQAYQQATQWDPNSTRGWLALGYLLEKQGKTDEAEKAYQRILQIQKGPAGQVKALQEMENPDYAVAYLRLAEIYRNRGRLPQALKYAQSGLESVQSYWKSLEVWKPIYQASGRYRPEEEEQMKEVEHRLRVLKKEVLRERTPGKRPF